MAESPSRSPRFAAGAGAAVILTGMLLATFPAVGIAIAAGICVAAVLRWPGVIIALSWNGFWLFLGALDLLGVNPHRSLTAAAYAIEAIALSAFIVHRRECLLTRLSQLTALSRVWVASALLLAIWFVANGLLLSEGPLAHRLLGVFIIVTVPTAIAVAAARRSDLEEARAGTVMLGLLFVVVQGVALRHGVGTAARFSPIAELDPVSAGAVAAIACVVATTYRFIRGALGLQVVGTAALACGAAITSARGPALALILTVAVLLLVRRNWSFVVVVAAVAIGLGSGVAAARAVGSAATLLGDVSPATATTTTTTTTTPAPAPKLSSFNIRKEWMKQALRDIPQRPIFGHGIAMLVDDTPEARVMGVSGERVYPHNDAVESAYSLGALGAILFALLVLIPIAVIVRGRATLARSPAIIVLGLFVYALAASNFSGEIGTDTLLWSTAALAVLWAIAPRRPNPQSLEMIDR